MTARNAIEHRKNVGPLVLEGLLVQDEKDW